jgi:hypothetical protein
VDANDNNRQHARHAYMQCNARALARFAQELFPGSNADIAHNVEPAALSTVSSANSLETSAESATEDPPAPLPDAVDPKQGGPQLSGEPQASMLDRKLSLESVLRSL